MTPNKKPAIIVAVVLAALIFIPLLLLLLTRTGGSGELGLGDVEPVRGGNAAATADFHLRQLAEKAEGLMAQDLAKALREGDISLEFMSALQGDAERGKDALQRGQLERAAEHYNRVVQAAEARLASLALADKARALSESSYAELLRLESLKAGFENTYREAVEAYDGGLRALNAGHYEDSIDGFEMAGAILGDLEARAIQRTAGLLEAADEALASYQLEAARRAYSRVMEYAPSNTAAAEGLATVAALEGIAAEVKTIRALEAEGKLEAALAELERLAADHPNNAFIDKQRASLQERMKERDYQALLADSIQAEAAEDFGAALAALEAALELKSTAEQQTRLARLKEQYKATRLEILLADGYEALSASRFEAARNFYKEAVALAPESKEARTGLEKASSLYLANIRYTQNIAASAKFIEEGRFPLAAKLFNDAMGIRPSQVSSEQQAAEVSIRNALDAQSKEVPITVESDKRTFVSIIGVLPPDRFKEKELKLFPDVYKVRGTRPGYESVEIELKVNATRPNPAITVECTQKI